MGIHKLLVSAAGNITPGPGPGPSIPAYYTSYSGYMLYQPGGFSTSLLLKDSSDINVNTYVSAYNGLPVLNESNYFQDKDDDTAGIYYGIQNVGWLPNNKTFYKVTLNTDGTTTNSVLINNDSTYPGMCFGACYAPKLLWDSTPNNGAIIITTEQNDYIWVFPFDTSTKNTFSTPYQILDSDGPAGIDVIPKQVSGFTQHYAVTIGGVAVAPARAYRFTSYTLDMTLGVFGWNNPTRSANYTRYTGTITPGVSYGPKYQGAILYYPPGKPVFRGDTTQINTNRIVCIETQSDRPDTNYWIFVWKLTEGTNAIIFSYLYMQQILDPYGVPNALSIPAALSISPGLPPLP